jgi:hypothetical protein
VLHVHFGEETVSLCRQWSALVEKPAREAGLPLPKLVVLDSPYRFIVKPIVEYAIQQQIAHPDRNITVLMPELVESHWYHYLLHNNRPEAIRALLLFNGNQRISVVSIPYHLRA